METISLRSCFNSLVHRLDDALSHSVMSDSSPPHGLQPTRLLCPWGFSRQEYWSGLPCPPLGDLHNLGIRPRSPALQANSLPAEPPGKHRLVEQHSIQWQMHYFDIVHDFHPCSQASLAWSIAKQQNVEWDGLLQVIFLYLQDKLVEKLALENGLCNIGDGVTLSPNTREPIAVF